MNKLSVWKRISWGQEEHQSEPDFRLRKKAPFPKNLWDDPQVEDLTRGEYKDRLRCPSKSRGLRILELACGSGWLALELARQGHKVEACDVSENRVEMARTYYLMLKNTGERIG